VSTDRKRDKGKGKKEDKTDKRHKEGTKKR
jgi:hypothetical protein